MQTLLEVFPMAENDSLHTTETDGEIMHYDIWLRESKMGEYNVLLEIQGIAPEFINETVKSLTSYCKPNSVEWMVNL